MFIPFLLPLPRVANPLRDDNDPQGNRRHNGQPRGGTDTPEEARRPDEVQPVQRVGPERTGPGAAVQHGPQLGGGHHRAGLYRAAQGSIRQVRGPGDRMWFWFLETPHHLDASL